MHSGFLRVVVTLPKASAKDENSKGWYARLSLKNRSNESLLHQNLVTKYNETNPRQSFIFSDDSVNPDHFIPGTDDFAVALYIEFFRYSFFGDEKIDCRHVSLVGGGEAGFDPIRGANVSEIAVRDVKQGANKKYYIRVETEWAGLSGRSRGPSEGEEQQQQEEEEPEVEGEEEKIMWDKLKADLKLLGCLEEEEKGILGLARQLFGRRSEFSLHDMARPSYTDAYKLINFYRGFGAEAWEELLKNSAWRLEEGCERLRGMALSEIIGCSVSEYEEHYQGGFLGVSADGSPIVVRKYGMLDLHKIGVVVGKDHEVKEGDTFEYFNRHHIWEMEWYNDLMRTLSFREGKIVKGSVFMDLDGLGMKQMGKETMKAIKKMMGDDSDNYPDSLRKLYIVNAPGFFTFIWKVIRPWLHPVVLAKIEMTGKGKDKLIVALEEAGAAECCKSKAYGGDAKPIKGITNSQCFLPFGGNEGVAPNSTDKWNANILVELCAQAGGGTGLKEVEAEAEANGVLTPDQRESNGELGGKVNEKSNRHTRHKDSQMNCNGGVRSPPKLSKEERDRRRLEMIQKNYYELHHQNIDANDFHEMKMEDKEDLAEIVKLLIMIVGVMFVAVTVGFMQRSVGKITILEL
ncbi:hypothetical protein TrST_g3006 [Triparma strigata]|uniref:CRAL-TRIO domain-containing protein n=1 Tax=Triparma strigata TaxID=1606541 RepID=A0A9W7ABJ3_9STRA|nr:hypothetical protein TrST_g3006 [Triparma strigata]